MMPHRSGRPAADNSLPASFVDEEGRDVDADSGVVRRLTAGIEPPRHREILMRCLSGTLSPAVALMQLLIETEDAAVVRATVDQVTRRAASVSRSSDSLLRDRVDDLTQLVVENEPGSFHLQKKV